MQPQVSSSGRGSWLLGLKDGFREHQGQHSEVGEGEGPERALLNRPAHLLASCISPMPSAKGQISS